MAVEWGTIASLATAGGTLVLAVSTFASVRSANRAARAAERSLMVGLQPLLVPSRLQDPDQKVFWVDNKHVVLPGGTGIAEVGGRERERLPGHVGAQRGERIAVMRSWRVWPEQLTSQQRPDLDGFRRHTRDLYVAPADVGFWQAAFRDAEDPQRAGVVQAVKSPPAGDRRRAVRRLRGRPAADQPVPDAAPRRHRDLDRVGLASLEPGPPRSPVATASLVTTAQWAAGNVHGTARTGPGR
jgi:hypothetical protein